jgi:hypothetical protein
MGAAIGLLGAGVLLPAFQQNLSIVAGILIITIFAFKRFTKFTLPLPSFLLPALQRLQGRIAILLKEQSIGALFGLGILNGLLPCGFVYVAMTAAAVTADVVRGMSFMAGFGLGTIPAMVAFSFSPRFVSISLRSRILRFLPAFTLLVGFLLIVRGLNLGIPFISPRLGATPSNQMILHHH